MPRYRREETREKDREESRDTTLIRWVCVFAGASGVNAIVLVFVVLGGGEYTPVGLFLRELQ